MNAFSRILGIFLLAVSPAVAAKVEKLSPSEAARRVAAGEAVLVDVREPSEWTATGVAEPAVLLPMSDFNGNRKLWKPFLEKNANKKLILYCRSGHRSGLVAKKLAAEGRTVANAGGFSAWKSAGLPIRPVLAP